MYLKYTLFLAALVLIFMLNQCNNATKSPKEKEQTETKDPDIRIVKEYHPNGRVKSVIEAKGKLRHGLTKTYDERGNLVSTIHYENNQKHGLAANYYSNGQKSIEINYQFGWKEGEARKYYQSGKLYRVTPYKQNSIDGIRKTYYESGQLQAEIPYKKGQLCVGLKEYTIDGKLKEMKAGITIREVDRTAMENAFYLKIALSDQSKNVEFYQGILTDDTYWNNQLTPIPSGNGVGTVKFYLTPGSYRMGTINIVAKKRTSLGNYYILQKKYNLAIENKI